MVVKVEMMHVKHSKHCLGTSEYYISVSFYCFGCYAQKLFWALTNYVISRSRVIDHIVYALIAYFICYKR